MALPNEGRATLVSLTTVQKITALPGATLQCTTYFSHWMSAKIIALPSLVLDIWKYFYLDGVTSDLHLACV